MSAGAEPEALARWVVPISATARRHLARQLVGDAAGAESAVSPEPEDCPDPAILVEAAIQGKIGLVAVNWPGVAQPLWLRAGSGDAADLIGAMRDTASQLCIPFAPRRIIEIGAGAGYRSIALAIAHPDATIASVEPIPARARLHALNTLACRRIIGVRAAIAQSASGFGVGNVVESGEPGSVCPASGGVGAISLAALYQSLGWDGADVLLIDPLACSDLDDAGVAPALALARLIAIRRPVPDLGGNLGDATHARRSSRDYELFFNRVYAHPAAPPRRTYAFDVGGPAIMCKRPDGTDAAWAFFPIGDTGFRLHPNPPGTTPASLILQHFLAGPHRFESMLRLNHRDANSVRFRVTIRAADTGRVIHQGDTVLRAGETARWGFDMPLFFGDATIEFATEMANGDSNGHAWADFIDPSFN